ncbi:MAG TPA: DUF883 family protein [Arenimonas sp.]|uniref:DUF883 family protein n=1 Tax=Arenimonas sp. TaxID=1872635 RepID=UPI002C3B90F3|nr:DUF883 family protein [Arenimonas sp.]HMB56505.1 DUF883 family protein [Arenimonas sp.]
MAKSKNADQEELMADLQDVLADTEAMLKDVANESGEMASALRERITANLQNVKAKLIETEQLVTHKAKVAAKATDTYVHDNPWQSVGVAAGIGFLVGLLVSRR